MNAHYRSILLAAALVAVGLAAIAPPSAWGHAAFLDSQPEPGTRVEKGPTEIELNFTEPLNRDLSTASLVNMRSGDRVAVALVSGGERRLVLRPQQRLGRAAYEVRWHTVSTLDGHPLEGSFSFGVRTAAAGDEHSVEQSPLARDGWLRIAVRAAFYAALFFFAGGVLNAALLSRRRPASWLLPEAIEGTASVAGIDPTERRERLRERTISAGGVALVLAIALALIESADAGSGLNANSIDGYLLSNGAGLARVGTIVALAIATLLAWRTVIAAAVALVIAFGTIALGGHANSADPRALALLTDWIHLVAAAAWVGGIAQLAAAWLPQIRGRGRELRLAVLRSVLPRFGRVALPAFAVVVVTGSLNALIQLGALDELWSSAYGRVLAVKISLVGLIATASYLHALRLRPRLLAGNPHPPERVERRHWRLLGVEPWLGLGAILAVAALVAFPLPPRQLSDTGEAAVPCSPSCPLPNPAPDELPVATHLGPDIAGFWLRRDADGLSGEMRLLDWNEKPVDAEVTTGEGSVDDCGTGCWRLARVPATRTLTVSIDTGERSGEVSVPTSFSRARDGAARRMLKEAQAAMRSLRSVRLEEQLSSGLGTQVKTAYRFAAPDRMAYHTSSGSTLIAIGKTSWLSSGGAPFEKGPFGAGSFRFQETFRWTVYGRSVRWLGASHRFVRLALFDPGTPVWYRLTIDRGTKRVVREQMVTGGHFMDRRYFAFNQPVGIEPPG